MNWDASTSTPLCISADGNITPLTLPQPPAPTMVCSGGQQLSADGKKCECPSGQSLQNGSVPQYCACGSATIGAAAVEYLSRQLRFYSRAGTTTPL